MLKAVIIDVELESQALVRQLLKEHCPDVSIMATESDELKGIRAIQENQPDLVFLGIQMPNYSGFKLLNFFEFIDFEVIFMAPDKEFAIEAFKADALGYLLKPIKLADLLRVIEKVRLIRGNSAGENLLSNDKQNWHKNYPERIVLPAANSLLFLHLDEISHLESDGRNTLVYFIHKSKPLRSTYTLKACANLFQNTPLLRVHRSFIINALHIQKFLKGKDMQVLMENGQMIAIGPNFKERLLEAIDFFIK